MTDDELGARIQDELRAVQAYFTHHEGGDSEEPIRRRRCSDTSLSRRRRMNGRDDLLRGRSPCETL